jgi:flagellar motor switch protein FliM
VSDAHFTFEEAAALRQATEAGVKATPERVALAASDKQAKRYLPVLEKSLKVLKESIRVQLTQALKAPCGVEAEPLQLSGPMAMRDALKGWLMGALIKQPTGETLAAVGVSPRLGFHLIELAYGAPNVPAKVLPSRDRLTLVERETLWPAVLTMAQELCQKLNLGAAPAVHIDPTGYPTELGQLATDESGVVQELTLKLGEYPATLSFVITPKALDGLRGDKEPRADAALGPQEAMAAHLGDAEVTLVAHLGKTKLPMSDIAALSPGKMIWLDKTPRDPVDVLVEGQHKFLAMPMQREGAVGVQILTRTP